MTPQDHYRQSEELAAKAVEEHAPEWVSALAQLAQVHATLSLHGLDDGNTWTTDLGRIR